MTVRSPVRSVAAGVKRQMARSMAGATRTMMTTLVDSS